MTAAIDPGVELLADIPIAGVAEDLLARSPIAQRIVELACAEPLAAPRAVGLVGGSGVGKTSVLRMVTELLGLDLLLRLFVPSLDGPRLDARTHLRDAAARQVLLAELETSIRTHRRAGAARAALRGLFQALERMTESA